METELTDAEKAKIADARLREDRDDFHNAIAGRETGRQVRFGGRTRDAETSERKKSERAFRDALDRLLQDAEYRVLYEQLGETLSDAERNADQTIADIQIALRQLDDDIADMEARAAKTLDGKLVFRTADGRVINEDGEELPPEIADGIQWPPNAPTAEEYFGAKGRRGELAAGLEEWQGYRNDTLGDIRNRYDDRENPMDKNDLSNAIQQIQASAPQASSFAQAAPSAISIDSHASPSHTLPTLGN